MSLRLSSSQSSHFVSRWSGLGIPGSEVPTTGDNGGSPLANDGISPASEYRLETVTAPSAGTLTVYPDTSYEFSGAPDGTYPWVYRLFEDSIDRGTATEYLVVGSPVASFASNTALPIFSGSAQVDGASPQVSFSTTTGLPTFSGSAHVSPVASFATTTELPAFSGAAASGTGFSFASTTALPSFSGAAYVSPVAAFAATTALPSFSGSANVQEPASFSFASTTGRPVFSGVVIGGGAGLSLTRNPRFVVRAGPRSFIVRATARNYVIKR